MKNKTFMLSCDAYDKNELLAKSSSCNRVIQSFGAEHFASVGYPTRVVNDNELHRYIDVMHETRFERDFTGILLGGGLSEDEFYLFKEILSIVKNYSESRFGKTIIPRGSLLRAINTLRHIRYVYKDKGKRPRIFEIGPGCGYLGLMLILEGYPYISTDVTQAFYLHQSNLMEFVCGNKLKEMALTEIADEIDFTVGDPNHPAHIPWWALPKALKRSTSFDVDVVTCNHAFSEMHVFAMAFYVALANKSLQSSEAPPAVIFEHLGAGPIHWGTVILRFMERGFRFCVNDEFISVFSPENCREASTGMDVSKYLQVMGEKGFSRNHIESVGYFNEHISIDDNFFFQNIAKGREALADNLSVSLKDVKEVYTSMTGSNRYVTSDEDFLMAIDFPI